jgi:hypothetical protein
MPTTSPNEATWGVQRSPQEGTPCSTMPPEAGSETPRGTSVGSNRLRVCTHGRSPPQKNCTVAPRAELGSTLALLMPRRLPVPSPHALPRRKRIPSPRPPRRPPETSARRSEAQWAGRSPRSRTGARTSWIEETGSVPNASLRDDKTKRPRPSAASVPCVAWVASRILSRAQHRSQRRRVPLQDGGQP